MTDYKEKMAMLVLSCDGYSDLWNDFFNLKEKFWPDCPFKWYIVTESKEYTRKDVEVIKCGKDLNWAGRFRKAVETVHAPFYGIYLEDYFICRKIDNERIIGLLNFAENNKVDFMDLCNIYRHKIDVENKQYFADHLIIIPKHLKYGIDTAAAIWERNYLLKELGEGDYSAWQFEKDRCDEALSEKGYQGLILCDDRLSFNVTEIPVVIQGKFYPPSIKFFKSLGYTIDTSQRSIMNPYQKFRIDALSYFKNSKHGRKFLKWVARTFMGYKFVTED